MEVHTHSKTDGHSCIGWTLQYRLNLDRGGQVTKTEHITGTPALDRYNYPVKVLITIRSQARQIRSDKEQSLVVHSGGFWGPTQCRPRVHLHSSTINRFPAKRPNNPANCRSQHDELPTPLTPLQYLLRRTMSTADPRPDTDSAPAGDLILTPPQPET